MAGKPGTAHLRWSAKLLLPLLRGRSVGLLTRGAARTRGALLARRADRGVATCSRAANSSVSFLKTRAARQWCQAAQGHVCCGASRWARGLPAAAVRCCARAGLRGWRMLRSTGVSGREQHLGMPPMLQSLGSPAAAAAAHSSWAAGTAVAAAAAISARTAAAAGTGRGSEGSSAAGSWSAGESFAGAYPVADSRAATRPGSWAATDGRWDSSPALAAAVAVADSPGQVAGCWLRRRHSAAGMADLRRQRKGQRQAAGWTDLGQGHLAPEVQMGRQGRRLRRQKTSCSQVCTWR